jgi:hypothetical protein
MDVMLAVHRIAGGLGADHADVSHPTTRVVMRHDALGLDRMDRRRLEAIRECVRFRRNAMAAGTAAEMRITRPRNTRCGRGGRI